MSACVAVASSRVEPRLWGDDCYSTGVGFKNALLMGGGGRFTGESCELRENQETRRRRRRLQGHSFHQWEQPAICWRQGEQQRGSAEVGRLHLCRRSFGKRKSCLSSSNERKYLKAPRHNASNELKMYVYFFILFIHLL